MASRRFWLLLSGTICVTIAALWLLHAYIPATQGISPFTLICIAVFVAINIAAYYLGKSAALSSSAFRFIHLMMTLIVVKMLICVLLVVLYVRLGEPSSKLFVIPFLLIYLLFTTFEIYVLEKLARMKPKTEENVRQKEPAGL